MRLALEVAIWRAVVAERRAVFRAFLFNPPIGPPRFRNECAHNLVPRLEKAAIAIAEVALWIELEV